MRLFLQGESKENIGYIPDSMYLTFKEKRKKKKLMLNIRGHVSYNPDNLRCEVQGEVIPNFSWEKGKMTILSEEKAKEEYPIEKIIEIFEKTYEVGIWLSIPEGIPLLTYEELSDRVCFDDITDCIGIIEIPRENKELYTKEFVFIPRKCSY